MENGLASLLRNVGFYGIRRAVAATVSEPLSLLTALETGGAAIREGIWHRILNPHSPDD